MKLKDEDVMDPVSSNMKRAYRDKLAPDMPSKMADLLRRLAEQERTA